MPSFSWLGRRIIAYPVPSIPRGMKSPVPSCIFRAMVPCHGPKSPVPTLAPPRHRRDGGQVALAARQAAAIAAAGHRTDLDIDVAGGRAGGWVDGEMMVK